MKTLFFSTLLLISFYSSKAQHYFPSDSVRWRMMHERMDAGNITRDMQDISFTDDTIIRSGLVFRKILEEYTWSFRLNGGPFLHIDSINNRVLFLRTPSPSDTIIPLYDFSLTVGDSMNTLERVNPNWVTTWHVIEDSTLLVNGELRRYLKVETGWIGHQDIWIEGIGSIHGLYAPIFEIPYSFEFGFHLACFTDSTTAVQYQPLDFFTQFYYDCNSVFSVEENQMRDFIKAYPNPTSETLVLENLYEESLEYVIYGMDGRRIKALTLSSQSKHNLDVKTWPVGMYSIVIRNNKNQTIYSTKINHF